MQVSMHPLQSGTSSRFVLLHPSSSIFIHLHIKHIAFSSTIHPSTSGQARSLHLLSSIPTSTHTLPPSWYYQRHNTTDMLWTNHLPFCCSSTDSKSRKTRSLFTVQRNSTTCNGQMTHLTTLITFSSCFLWTIQGRMTFVITTKTLKRTFSFFLLFLNYITLGLY